MLPPPPSAMKEISVCTLAHVVSGKSATYAVSICLYCFLLNPNKSVFSGTNCDLSVSYLRYSYNLCEVMVMQRRRDAGWCWRGPICFE